MQPKAITIHKTSHAATAEPDGRVLVYCQDCGWRDYVDTSGLLYREALEAIYAARDGHEADAKAQAAHP